MNADAYVDKTRVCKHSVHAVAYAIVDDFADVDANAS